MGPGSSAVISTATSCAESGAGGGGATKCACGEGVRHADAVSYDLFVLKVVQGAGAL